MQSTWKRSIARLAAALILLPLAAATAAAAPAAAKRELLYVPEEQLIPDLKHNRATGIILHILKNYHYKKVRVDDALSDQVLDNYLKALDPNRQFFMLEQVNDFSIKYRYRLDEALLTRNLEPAFEIYRQFRRLVQQAVRHAQSLLEGEFDFTADENYTYDRRDGPWAVSLKERDEIWRKRVKNDLLSLHLAGKEGAEARETLASRYRSIETAIMQRNSDDIFQVFINSFTTAVEPHTSYLSARTSENFDISMQLSLEGIGAVLHSTNGEYTTIQRLILGGPAALSGELEAEDRIVGVGQGSSGQLSDVIGMRLDDVVDLIRGPKGSIVRLEILPKGRGPEGPTRIVRLTRDKVRLQQRAAQSFTIQLPEERQIGVIDIPSFYVDFKAQTRGDEDYRSTSRDVRNLLSGLKEENVEGIVIDLRGNGGGSLREALELTGMFIKTGPIIQTRDSRGKIEINHDSDPEVLYTGPLAVLVDRSSASASEIFAGAIQDYRRGIIIGEPTFGKGTVQNILDLNRYYQSDSEDLGKLKTTIAQFFRISGGSNQYRGVEPDIVFPTAENDSDYGERALENALRWDTLHPLDYSPLPPPTVSIEQLRRKHLERVASDPDFELLRKEIQISLENRERRTVSLRETKRREQHQELLALQKEEDGRLSGERDADEEGQEKRSNYLLDQVDLLLREATRILSDLTATPPVSQAADLQPS